jgi:aminoglycoside phosphotransferase (APT) family kinase protein
VSDLPGLDVDALAAWLSGSGRPADVSDVRPLAGGTQNLVYALTVGGRELVLRRPPLHPRSYSNRSIVREMRILEALRGSEVPHPELYAGCEDEDVLGVAFYLMDRVDGFNPDLEVGRAYELIPAWRDELGMSMARSLAAVAQVPFDRARAAGLSDGSGFLARQLDNHARQWREFTELPGYPVNWLPRVEETAELLRTRLPAHSAVGIVHGDFSLNNVLVDRTAPRVAAVLDWEMCTMGDPLFDLGWFLLTWPEGDAAAVVSTGRRLASLSGLPSRSRIVEEYVAAGGPRTDDIDGYCAVAAFKLGIIIESSYVRSLSGQASAELGESTHRLARELLITADRLTRGEWSILHGS